jgi:hypothetical protein
VPNSEAARGREAGIVKVILGAGGTSIAEFGGPPVTKGLCSFRDEQTDAGMTSALTLRLRLACLGRAEQRLRAQEVGKFPAEGIDTVFKALFEHVADHDHPALRPLTHAAKIRVSELSLGAIANHQRVEQSLHGVATDGMAPRQSSTIASPSGVSSCIAIGSSSTIASR